MSRSRPKPPWSPLKLPSRCGDAMSIVLTEAHPSMFPSEEYIGEGKQARLDLAIDETAVKGKWRPPTPRPQQMPGQIGMEES